MEISIVIVNYNTHEHLIKCLDSININKDGIAIEIIVVDSNSPDRSIIDLSEKYKDVKFLFLDVNNGFGYGCNRGVDEAKGKYILLLNPDIIVTNNSLSNLYNYAENNPDAAGFTGLLMDESNKLAYCYNNFPDLKWEMKEAFGIGAESFVNGLLARSEIKDNIPFDIDWAHGACFMIRKSVYEEINGFDENIFLYYEDIDIQKRLKSRGYRNVCIPSSKFYHFTRSSLTDEGSDKIYYFYMHKSKKYYLRKYFNVYTYYLINAVYILAYLTKIPLLPFRKKFRGIKVAKLNHYFIILGVYTKYCEKFDSN
ncbi:MAG: glycosyltransferase family 2 protein [Ignavibacteria bacterium]